LTATVATQTSDISEQINQNLDKVKSGEFIDLLKSSIPYLIKIGYQILIIILIFIIGKKAINILSKTLIKALDKVDVDMGIKKFVVSIVRVICYAFMIFIMADRLGVSSASIVAILGSAGIAIGLSLQGSLSNFAGGLLLLFVKPFVIGDYIVSQSAEGVVQSIGLIYTTLITIDNKKITLPNGSLSNGIITNVTAKEVRRLDISVGIGYKSDMLKAKKILESLLTEQELVLKDKGIQVYVDELADSAVILVVRAWTKTEDYWTVKWDATEKIKLEFDKNDIEIPYNQMDVHVI